VISHDELSRSSETVIALAITSKEQRSGYPLTHQLRSGSLPRDSWVKMSQVRTLAVERLRDRVGAVEAEELSEIVEGFIELVA
jgi:mRNA interferase MazF